MVDPFELNDFDTPRDPFDITESRDPFVDNMASPKEVSDAVAPKSVKPKDPFADLSKLDIPKSPVVADIEPEPEEPAKKGALEALAESPKTAIKGFSRFVDSTQGMAYGLQALAGDAVGWDRLRDTGAQGYARNMQEAARNASRVSFQDIDSVGDFIEWAAGGAGELVPTAAMMMASGGITGAAAKAFLPTLGREAVKRLGMKKIRKEIGEKGVEKLIAKGELSGAMDRVLWNLGATAGGYASNAGLGIGETYGNFIDADTGEISSTSPRLGRVLGSIGGGLLIGALDTAMPAKALAKVNPIRSTAIRNIVDTVSSSPKAKAAAAKLLLGAVGEGTTEAAQELVSYTVGATVDEVKEWDWSEFKPQAIEAFALGALGGTLLGGGVTAMEVLQNRGVKRDDPSLDTPMSVDQHINVHQMAYDNIASETELSPAEVQFKERFEGAQGEAAAEVNELGLDPKSDAAKEIFSNKLNELAAQQIIESRESSDAPSATNPIAPTADPVSAKQAAQMNVQTARETGGSDGTRQTIRGVVHYSNKPGLNELDPSFHGTGIRGEEAKRKKAYPDLYKDRIYVGLEGYNKEKGLLNNKYDINVDDELLYDQADDPDGLISIAAAESETGDIQEIRTRFEKLVSDRGYLGIRSEEGNMATIFSRIPTDKPITKAWWENETGKKFEPKKVFSKKEFAANAAPEIERVKAAPYEEATGATFNVDGTPYTGGGIVVGISSQDNFIPTVTPESQAAFAAGHAKKLSHPLAKNGIYKFPLSNHGSYDLNLVLPAENQADALELAKHLRQESIYNLETGENIKTGFDGKNPRTVSDEEFFELADRYSPSLSSVAIGKLGGNQETGRVAQAYADSAGINNELRVRNLAPDPEYLKRMADFLEGSDNNLDAPGVRESYDALAKETMAQYQSMVDAGIEIEPYEGSGEPYASSAEMAADVRDNKHLWFFMTESGFGEGSSDKSHPLLQDTGVEIGGKKLVYNDLFRAVHDYFGHTKNNSQFGPRGEYNAFLAHADMFTEAALPALAAETLAQNAWVNYGKHIRREDGSIPKRGEPDFIPAQDRPFADQKTFVVPLDMLPEDLKRDGEASLSDDRSTTREPSTITSTAQTQTQAINLVKNVTTAAQRMGLRVDVRAPDTTNPDPFFQNVGGSYNPSQKTINLVISSELTHTDQVVVLHEVLHDLYATAPKSIQDALLRWVDKMSAGDFKPLTDRQSTDPRIRPDNPYNLPEMELKEEQLVEQLATEGVDSNVAEGIVSDLVRILKDLWYRAAIKFQEMFGTKVSEEIAIVWAQNKVQAMIAGQDPSMDLWSMVRGGTKSTQVNENQAIHQPLSSFAYRMSNGAMIIQDLVPVDSDAAIANIESIIDQGNAEMVLADTDNRRKGEEGLRYTTQRSVERMAQLNSDYFAALDVGNTEMADRLVAEAADLAGYPEANSDDAVLAARDEFLGRVETEGGALELDFSTINQGGVWRLVLDHIGVDESSRGSGIASRAMKLLTSIADDRGVAIDLEVGEDSAGIDLVSFYSRHGFEWEDGNMIRMAGQDRDTITRDDQGNIIPLSERFNVESDNIRFTQRPVEATKREMQEQQMRRLESSVRQDIATFNEINAAYAPTLNKLSPEVSREEFFMASGLEDPLLSIQNVLIRYEAEKNLLLPDYQDSVSANDRLDTLTDAQNAVAREKTYRAIQVAQTKLGAKLSRDIDTADKSSKKIEADEDRYNSLIAKMGDLKETEREVRLGISQQIQLLLQDLRANNRAQSKKGIAGRILQDLESKLEAVPFPKNTEKLLKGLINNDTPLLLISRELMNLDVDWSKDSPTEVYKDALAAIKEEVKVNLDTPLSELLSGKPFERGASSLKALVESGDVDSLRGSAFLATMVAFVKNNRTTADALAASSQTAQVNMEITEGLAAVKNAKVIEDANRILDIYRTKAPSAVRDRIVVRFAKAKKEMNQAKKSLRDAKKRIAILSPAAGDMHKAYDRASEEIGKNGNWQFQDGAEVPVPQSMEQTPREVLYGKSEKIDMTQFGSNVKGRKDGMTYVGDMSRKLNDYLNANKEYENQYEYQEIRRIAESLGLQCIESMVVESDPGGIGFRLRDPGSQMRNSGTVAGSRVASRMEEFTKLNLKYQGQVYAGYRFSKKYRDARKAADMGSNDAFYYLCNKALAFLEGERVLSGQAAFNAMFKSLSSDPNAARAFGQKGSEDKFQALIEEWAEQSATMDAVREREGLLIRDENGDVNPFTGEKKDLYRDSLNRGLFMVPRVLSRRAFSVMRNWMGTVGNEAIFTQSSPLSVADYESNPEGVSARVKKVLNSSKSFFDHVVTPFILNDRRNKYPHPEDGSINLDLSEVSSAWNEANADVVGTAEILADRFGVPREEYVPKFFGAFMGQMHKFYRKNEEAQKSKKKSNTGNVSTFAADSRVDDDFPSEMTEYITFSHQQNSVSIKQIAIEKSMGRNMEGLFSDIDATSSDINKMADIYNAAVEDNGKDMKAVKAQLGKDFKIYKAASKAEKLGTYDSKNWVDNMKSILGDRDNMSDIGMWETGFGAVITGLLSGWKTGAKQLSQVYSGFMSDGAISRWNFLDPFQKTMETGVMLASWPFRLFGLGFDLKSVHRTALLDAGIQDFEGAIPLSERFSDLGFDREFEKDNRPWAKKIIRGIQSAASGTTLQMGERKHFSPSGSPIPFRALNMSSAMFDTNSVMKKMIKVAEDVGAYLKDNPNAVESDITAENLGYKDRIWGWDDATDFTNFKTQLNAGQSMSLISLANEVSARQSEGLYPLSKDSIASAYAFTKTNRSFESTLTSRPGFSQKNTIGRLSLSLLGWSMEVAMQTSNILTGRDTTGRRKNTAQIASSIAGLKAVMFGVMPYALIYSMFFDFWDEEISGKKSDLRPLTTANGLDEFAMSVLERVGNMGPVGMWGEIANSAVNMGTGKKMLSFDERVVWASTLMSVQNLFSSVVAVDGIKNPENLTYNTFWRPLGQAMGFGGTLSNMQVINNVFGFDNAESRTAERTNVNNALRGAGRSVGVEVRQYGSGGMARPTPVTPHVTNMILAALADDGARFEASFESATKAMMDSKDLGEGEARDRVARSFSARHPIKSVFRTPPTTEEYRKMLSVMNPNMRFAVEDGLDSFSKWGQTIGVKPYFGKRVKAKGQKKLADAPSRSTVTNNMSDSINSIFEI